MAEGGAGEVGGLVFARFAEMRFGVLVTFENVYDLEAPFDIAKEYHIASVGKAADIRVQLRAGAAECSFERRQIVAFRT